MPRQELHNRSEKDYTRPGKQLADVSIRLKRRFHKRKGESGVEGIKVFEGKVKRAEGTPRAPVGKDILFLLEQINANATISTRRGELISQSSFSYFFAVFGILISFNTVRIL